MKKLKVIQIGGEHDHAAPVFSSLRRQSDLFDVLGYVIPEDDLNYQFDGAKQYFAGSKPSEGAKKHFQDMPRYTLEEALKLLSFPRRLGSYEGVDVQVFKGRYGPYIKYGDKNISLPRGADPMRLGLEECIPLVQAALGGTSAGSVIREFQPAGISVLNGRYGPYIKFDGRNFRIPRGTDAAALTEADCRRIISEAPAAAPAPRTRRYKKPNKP